MRGIRLVCLLGLLHLPAVVWGQSVVPIVNSAKLVKADSLWVDSIYQSLSLPQRIGQLYMVAAYSGGEKYNQPLIEQLIRDQGIGGVIFMQGTAEAQAQQYNYYQSVAKVPIWTGMDAEWGLGMRLTGVRDFPRQLMLGAMQDSTLVYRMGSAVAEQCRRMGVQIDFAPVVDINNNPNNPVINFRSFGENKYKVANYGWQYMKGLQDNGVMACAKHFPGHGDTDVDSHKDLPEIHKSINELRQLEFYPFKELIQKGIQSVMVAHLQIPAIDDSPHTPTTLSDKAIQGILRGELHFSGLSFTDALNMQGVAKYYEPGDIDLKAFKAGNDVLLFSQDVPTGIAKIEKAIQDSLISEARLEQSVKKILFAKYQAGLYRRDTLATSGLTEALNLRVSPIRRQVAEAAITLLNDPHQLIEKIKNNSGKSICYVGVGIQSDNAFSRALQQAGIHKIVFAPNENGKPLKKLLHNLRNEDIIIIGVHGMNQSAAQNFGLSEVEKNLIHTLSASGHSLKVLFGNPYALKFFCEEDGFIVAYDEAEETQVAAAKIVSGQLKARGKLPVSVCETYKAGDGILSLTGNLGEINDTNRYVQEVKQIDTHTTSIIVKPLPNDHSLICCVNPEAVGASETELDKLDNFIQTCIQEGAFPGCRIMAAKGGKVFYDKAFGYLDENKKEAVDQNTLYDIASITKVAATTLAVMKLYEQGKLDIDAQLGTYLPAVRGSDKEPLRIRDILTHQAGLKAWIPFYKEILDSTSHPKQTLYNKSLSPTFPTRVCDQLYIRNDWKDSIWNRILSSPLENKGKYVYSDLDFIFMQKVVEELSGMSLDKYVQENFYTPMGLKDILYNPAKQNRVNNIAPSEYDDYFRHKVLQGDVHDMGAAMMGGVSGHAGLFATANDLGAIFQMLLNHGVYKGKRYLQASTIDIFTKKNSLISRRALGFDKPETASGKGSPCADNTSASTFGHQGFTGTCVWADPDNDILYIFLSNRTYPTAENKLITKFNTREKTQEYIYNALGIASRFRK